MLNFIPSTALTPRKPCTVWTRQHDIDLLLGIYDHGLGNFDLMLKDKSLLFPTMNTRISLQYSNLTSRVKYLVSLIKIYSENFANFDF